MCNKFHNDSKVTISKITSPHVLTFHCQQRSLIRVHSLIRWNQSISFYCQQRSLIVHSLIRWDPSFSFFPELEPESPFHRLSSPAAAMFRRTSLLQSLRMNTTRIEIMLKEELTRDVRLMYFSLKKGSTITINFEQNLSCYGGNLSVKSEYVKR